jgi:SAM-dependent methyltransferase
MYSTKIDLLVKNVLAGEEDFKKEAILNFEREELVRLHWQYHPRFRFLKSATTRGGSVLDIGGGTGGIVWWKEYLAPMRDDLKIFAIDLKKGQYFDQLNGYHLVNLDKEEIPYENGSFDFIMMSHLIEHVQDWKQLLIKCNKVLRPNGVIYIETPSIHSTNLPSQSVFLGKGYDCSTINFYDDITHTTIVDLNQVDNFAESIGMLSIEKGFCRNRYLEDELISFGYHNRDQEVTTYGLWSKLLFASYIALQKI